MVEIGCATCMPIQQDYGMSIHNCLCGDEQTRRVLGICRARNTERQTRGQQAQKTFDCSACACQQIKGAKHAYFQYGQPMSKLGRKRHQPLIACPGPRLRKLRRRKQMNVGKPNATSHEFVLLGHRQRFVVGRNRCLRKQCCMTSHAASSLAGQRSSAPTLRANQRWYERLQDC